MLKALSQINPSCVKEYLIKNCKKMPRVAYRYALEKFDKETRNMLMQIINDIGNEFEVTVP